MLLKNSFKACGYVIAVQFKPLQILWNWLFKVSTLHNILCPTKCGYVCTYCPYASGGTEHGDVHGASTYFSLTLQVTAAALCWNLCSGMLRLMANRLGTGSCKTAFLYFSSQVALSCSQRAVLVVLKRGKRKESFANSTSFSITRQITLCEWVQSSEHMRCYIR